MPPRTTRCLTALILALAATAAAAPPPGAGGATTQPAQQQAQPDIAPEVRAVLEQVRSAYTNLKTARFDGTMTAHMRLDGKPSETKRTFTSSFQAPAKFRHKMGDDLTIGSTGEKVFAYNRLDNSYILADAASAKTPINDLPRPIPEILSSQNPSLMLAVEKDPLESLLTLVQNLKKVPDRQIDGKSYTALVAENPGVDVTVLIDPKTHLLRRLEVKMTGATTQPAASGAGAGAAAPPVEVVGMTLDYTQIDTSPNFEPNHFAWTPPEGSTDLAAARPRVQQTAAKALVGQPAPEFKLDTLTGESVSLADLKGQIVLLDFWASWCPPCVESLPHLGKLYGQEQDGVKVLAVNLMEDKQSVQAFAAAQQIDVPILLDTAGAVAQKYQVSAIPQTVLIGPDGVVRKVFVGLGPDMYSQLSEEIRQLKSSDAAVTAGATTAPSEAPPAP